MAVRVSRTRIAFSDIEAGDRLRVRYTEGGSEAGARAAGRLGAGRSISVTRTMVAEAAVSALGTVWLTADGHTLVHRGWEDLEIIRLTDEPVVVESRVGMPWSDADMEVLLQWDKPDRLVARQLGRTQVSVQVRRSSVRRGLLASV